MSFIRSLTRLNLFGNSGTRGTVNPAFFRGPKTTNLTDLEQNRRDCHRLFSLKSDYSEKSVQLTLDVVTNRLSNAKVPEPRISACHLVGKVLGITNVDAIEKSQLELSPDQINKLESFVLCRLARMPVQYIVGDWDFRSITLRTRPPVFIPRPETEQLVGLVLDHAKKYQLQC